MKIKAVLFDIGGVLYRSEVAPNHQKWEQLLQLPEGELAEIIFSNPTAVSDTLGEAAPDDIWSEVGRLLGIQTEEIEALIDDFWLDGEWDTDFLTLIHSRRPRFKIGTISDAWTDARQNIKDFLNNEIFDIVIFSAEEGVMKPHPGKIVVML
jgi:FMN phosphatase YigB (HAD superfamily)